MDTVFSKPDEKPKEGNRSARRKTLQPKFRSSEVPQGPYPPACVCNISIYTHHTHHFYLQPVFSQPVSSVQFFPKKRLKKLKLQLCLDSIKRSWWSQARVRLTDLTIALKIYAVSLTDINFCIQGPKFLIHRIIGDRDCAFSHYAKTACARALYLSTCTNLRARAAQPI